MSGTTTMPDIPVRDAIIRSTAVVRGYATSTNKAEWTHTHDEIVTDFTFHVTSWLKGTGPQEITIRASGGTVGNTTQAGSGFAAPAVGKDQVLLITREKGTVLGLDGSQYYISFGGFGLYFVEGDQARNSIAEKKSMKLGALLELVSEVALAR